MRSSLPLVFAALLVPSAVAAQEPAAPDFSQVTRPVVEIRDPTVIEFILFELFIEPLAPPTHLQVIDLTQNGFGPQDIVVTQPSGEAFLVPDFLSPEMNALMGEWRPDVEYRMDSGNIPLDALGALIASDPDDSRRAESAIMYDVVEAVERSYRDLPLGILFVRDSLGFTFQLWDYNDAAMFYQPKLATVDADSTVTTVVEMLRDIGYVPGRDVVGTGRTLDASLAVAPVEQTLFGIGGVADEQVRILASRTVLLGSYDFDRSGAIDTAREIDAPRCEVWLVLETGFPGFLERFGFTEPAVPYIGNTVLSIGTNVKDAAARRATACLEGDEPAPTDPATVPVLNPITEDLAPAPVEDHIARDASTAMIRAAGGVPAGSSLWADEVRGVLLDRFDTDGSGALDARAELRAVPCLVWLSVAATHGDFDQEFGFAADEGYIGDRIGIAPSQRADAWTLLRGCRAGSTPTATRSVRPRTGPSSVVNRWGATPVTLEVSLQAIERIPQEDRRQLAAKTLMLAVFDQDGSGRIDQPAELEAMRCDVWNSMEIAFPGYGGRFGITDRRVPYLGNVFFSISESLRPPLADRVSACLEGREPPPVPNVDTDQPGTLIALPVQVREYLDLEAAGRIVREGHGIAPGSAAWAVLVREVLIAEYDLDASGSLDRDEEVAQISCVVWETIRVTSGGALPGLGFGRRGEYFGDRIGVAEAMRQVVDRTLRGCAR